MEHSRVRAHGQWPQLFNSHIVSPTPQPVTYQLSTQQSLTPNTLRAEIMLDEPLAGYKKRARTRLQELMLKESYPPGHPMVVGTGFHLDMGTAAAASAVYSAPSVAHFYKGCDLFYQVWCPPAAPLSPGDGTQDPPTKPFF
ncbi:uncharacterized protein LOC106670096 [Cimex lectularius]|uniref:Uncharacterized protein n=1 Tax=Cimex lectularius TaxID=79782 RepID=A0A8I6S1V9_CIMLE|nr:uncharacterized protein LOC106670096 [Cimex lectularius]